VSTVRSGLSSPRVGPPSQLPRKESLALIAYFVLLTLLSEAEFTFLAPTCPTWVARTQNLKDLGDIVKFTPDQGSSRGLGAAMLVDPWNTRGSGVQTKRGV
jgi:hypothetical protein